MSGLIDRFGNPIITAKPASAAYSPAPRHIYWMQPRELPLFTFTMIRFMLVDPTVRLGLAMRRAPLSALRFAYKQGDQWIDGVECKHPKVKEYLDKQIKKCWVTICDKMLTDQIWGWSAGEIMYRPKNDKVVFDNILDRHAVDSRALEKHSRQVGVQFQNTGRPAQVRLGMNKAWWCAFRPEANRFYGDSIMRGAYSPFADKWFDGGALDSARLFMHTDAYSGRSIGCPPGTINLDGIGEVPTRDVAREMAEMMKTGAVVVYPLIYDDRGNKKWDIQPATVSQNPQHILQYPKDLDVQILRGMEIPDDVLTAEATGSWQGKRVPMQAFYTGLNMWAHAVVDTMRRSILEWLVWWNWGKAIDFDVTFQPLDEQAMEQFKKDQGQGGGQAGPPGAGGPPGPAGPGGAAGGPGGQPQDNGPPDMTGGGAPPMQLSLRKRDLAVAVGRGVLSASDIVKHARRTARKELRRRMAKDESGNWVTIGGEARDGKKHAGGTPVKVKGGKVVQGPDHLEGHPVNDLPGKPKRDAEGGNGGKSPGGERRNRNLDDDIDAMIGGGRRNMPSITGELSAAARDASGLDIDGSPLVNGIGYDDNPNSNWAGRYTVGNQRFATKHQAQAHVRKMRKQQQQQQQEASKPKKPSPEQAKQAAADLAKQYRESGTPHAKAAKELIDRHVRGIGDRHDKAREAAWQGFAKLHQAGALKVDEDGVMYAMKDGEKRPVVVNSNGTPNYGSEPYGDYRRKTLFARRRGEQRDGAPRPVSASETAQRRKRGLPGANSELGREIEKAVGPDLDDQAAFQGIVDAIFKKRTKAGEQLPKHDKSIINEAKHAANAFGAGKPVGSPTVSVGGPTRISPHSSDDDVKKAMHGIPAMIQAEKHDISGFTTSKGSTYTVNGKSTQRDKAAHELHDQKDVGMKRPSDATVFMSPEDAQRIGMHMSMQGTKPRIVVQNGKVLLLSRNAQTGKWGKHGEAIAFTGTPAVGHAPVEFWSDGTVHPGNAITEVRKKQAGKRMGRDLQEGEGEWITIGGHKDGDEDHAGGTPVQISDTGHIAKGPAALKGRHMEDVDNDRKDEHKSEFKPRTKVGAKRRTGAAILDIDDISIDAPRFQYKFEGVGGEGVTKQFSDIQFNPELAGILYVWHDHEDGKTYVINGHHRYELAKRSGWKGRMPVRYIDRETAQEARAFGALVNIAGGNGTAMDAAKFMRDMGMNGAEGVAHFKKHNISLKGAIAADAIKLANLSDNLFRELVFGRLELNHAKAIGEELKPSDGASDEEKYAIYDAQNKLLKRIQGAKKRIPDAVVREMALNASLSPRVKKEGGASLFGDDDEEEVLFEDRAAVQSYVREQLTGLVRGFGAVSASGRESLLRESGVGDVSSEAAAAKKAESQDALSRFEREIRYRGDVGAKLNGVLNNAALQHRNAKNTRDRNEVKKQAVEAVKRIMQEASQAGEQGMTSGG